MNENGLSSVFVTFSSVERVSLSRVTCKIYHKNKRNDAAEMCGTATAKLRHVRSRRHDLRFVEDYTSEWIYCEQIIKETS